MSPPHWQPTTVVSRAHLRTSQLSRSAASASCLCPHPVGAWEHPRTGAPPESKLHAYPYCPGVPCVGIDLRHVRHRKHGVDYLLDPTPLRHEMKKIDSLICEENSCHNPHARERAPRSARHHHKWPSTSAASRGHRAPRLQTPLSRSTSAVPTWLSRQQSEIGVRPYESCASTSGPASSKALCYRHRATPAHAVRANHPQGVLPLEGPLPRVRAARLPIPGSPGRRR